MLGRLAPDRLQASVLDRKHEAFEPLVTVVVVPAHLDFKNDREDYSRAVLRGGHVRDVKFDGLPRRHPMVAEVSVACHRCEELMSDRPWSEIALILAPWKRNLDVGRHRLPDMVNDVEEFAAVLAKLEARPDQDTL